MKTVKLLNPATGKTNNVPVAELAPDTIRVRTLDQGVVYLRLKDIERNTQPVHPTFPLKARAHLCRIQSALKEVDPDTLAGWERSFRLDFNPDREVRVWLWIAKTYLRLVSGRWHSNARKRDYFQLCKNWTMSRDVDVVIATTELAKIEPREAREILAVLPDREVSIETLLIENPLVSDSPPIWDFMGITDSTQFKDMVDDADAIIAIDTRSNTFRRDGRFIVAHGLEMLREKKASGADDKEGIAFFALDFHYAHEVARFIHAVYAATGHLCDDFTIREDEELEHPQD
jgi:hypothetical protein